MGVVDDFIANTVMASSKESSSPIRVQFSDDILPKTESKRRVELTQRYDRDAVQKRLDIESWIDEQLKLLFECSVSSRLSFMTMISYTNII